MSALSMFRELAGAEWRSVRRDPMLRAMLVILFLVAFSSRWLVPWISKRFDVDLVPHYPLIMSAMVVFLAPVMIGFIVGILLLEERDEGTLQAMGVTPLPMWKYLSWRLAMPVVVGTVLTILMFPIAGLLPWRWSYLPAVAIGALWAPLLALMMTCFARNKLQGFVLMRVSNLLLVIPAAAWFFPKLSALFALFPAYWPMKSLWLAAEGKSGVTSFLIGAAFHLVLIAWLYRKFQTVLRKSA